MDTFTQLLQGLRWQDILDILLNSYIIFRFYVIFRGTNVIRMLIALVMLYILNRVAMSMGLIVTSWAIQGIIAATALIIIIVFRNEIAGVFQVRSIRSFFWGIPQRQAQTPIDIIVESVQELARHKLGALIVLPLKSGLEDVVHGGVLWRGIISKEMLISIFWHGTPVHDGAAVIQGNQIVRVGAILPLSKNNTLPSHFGTRHRAAAGLSEQTDALVIVVSEERGEITIFKDQSIIKIKDTAQLNKILLAHAGSASAGIGVKNQKIELIAAAAICLIGVTSIWFSFARGFETLATLEVPVEFTNRDTKMVIFSASASSVKLQLSGSGSLIRYLRPDQVKVKLNLANAVAGDNQIPITRDGVILPPGIELKQIQPQTLKVNLDVLEEKTLAIQPDWSGRLNEGLILKNAYTVPEKVTVEGGHLMLKDIRVIYTEKISLATITEDGKVSVDLALLPSSLKLADASEENVEVVYTVVPRPPLREPQ